MENVERRSTEGRLEQDGSIFVPQGRSKPLIRPLLELVRCGGMNLLQATDIHLPSSKLKEKCTPIIGVGDNPYIESQHTKRIHRHQRITRQKQAKRNYIASEGSGGSGGRKDGNRVRLAGNEANWSTPARHTCLPW